MANSHQTNVIPFPSRPQIDDPTAGWEQTLHDAERHLGSAALALETYLAQASARRLADPKQPRRTLIAHWLLGEILLLAIASVAFGVFDEEGKAPHITHIGAPFGLAMLLLMSLIVCSLVISLRFYRRSIRSYAPPRAKRDIDMRPIDRERDQMARAPAARTIVDRAPADRQARPTTRDPSPVDALAFRRHARRLATYQPFSSSNRMLDHARGLFVLAAAHENLGQMASPDECRSIIQSLWGLDLELDEIRAVTHQLAGTDLIHLEGPRFALTETGRRQLAGRVRTSSETEAAAFAQWEDSVYRIAPSLTSEQLRYLQEDLVTWVNQIIIEYGVKAALLLDPEDEHYNKLIEEIEATGFASLPEREPSLTLIRQDALLSFIRRMTFMQRRYFDDLMKAAYQLSVFTLEPAALDVTRRLIDGQRIYLDTNIVYSILRLNGPEAYLSARRTLELSRQLGYDICVTPWTVAEMRQCVDAALTKLAHTQSSPSPLADVPPGATDSRVSDTRGKALRGTGQEIGIDLGAFSDPQEQIELLLMNEGIEMIDADCHAVDRDASGVAEQIAALQRVRNGSEAPRALQEHDVKHRLLIERLRGDERRRFSNAGWFFVTNDLALIRYADENGKHPGEVPFAVSLGEWTHIVRSLCPRTNDYEKTLISLLETPSIRSSGLAHHAEIIEAIARINTNERYSETIATRLLVDTALGRDGTEATDGARSQEWIA
jgi:hypothetical protein